MFKYVLMSTDMAKNIFKDSSLKNSTNTTKKQYWSIVRSDRFVRFFENCCNVSKFPKRRDTFLPQRQIKQFAEQTTNSVCSGNYHMVINIIWSRCFLRVEARDNQMSFMSCSGFTYSVAKISNVHYFHQVAHEKQGKNQPLLEWTKDLVNHFLHTAEICNTQEEYIVSLLKLNYELEKKSNYLDSCCNTSLFWKIKKKHKSNKQNGSQNK